MKLRSRGPDVVCGKPKTTQQQQRVSKAKKKKPEHAEKVLRRLSTALEIQKRKSLETEESLCEPSLKPCAVVHIDVSHNETTKTGRCTAKKVQVNVPQSDNSEGKGSKMFKRCALVASTPLVCGMEPLGDLPSNIQNDLSGDYWSAESQISKIPLRSNGSTQGHINSVASQSTTTSGRKSRPVDKLQYSKEEKVPTPRVKRATSCTEEKAPTPHVKRVTSCTIRKLQYVQPDPSQKQKNKCTLPTSTARRRLSSGSKKVADTSSSHRVGINSKNTCSSSSRRVSGSVKKCTSSRRKSLSITKKDYRRGSLLKNYMASSSSFSTINGGKRGKKATPGFVKPAPVPMRKEPEKPVGKPVGKKVGTDKKADLKSQSFAMERFLMKQNSKSLSKTFTSLAKKNTSMNQSMFLGNYLPNGKNNQSYHPPNASYISNMSSCTLDQSQISLVNRKRRKKLYSQKEMFANSPALMLDGSENTNMKNNSNKSNRSRITTKKNVSSKAGFEDIVELEETNEEFSSIKIDEEVSVCVKTNSLNTTASSLPLSASKRKSLPRRETALANKENSYVIHSREKSKTSINTINEKFNGSFISDASGKCNAKNDVATEDEPVTTKGSESLHQKKIPQQYLEDKNEKNGERSKQTDSEPAVVKKAQTCFIKKKKKLHKTAAVFFDLESSMNEERGNKTYSNGMNVTCNQSIMASVLNFNQ